MGQHGFEVRGIEQTKDAKAHASADDLLPRLNTLLENFDYIIVQARGGGVERVIILGEKAAYTPPQMVETGGGEETPAEEAPPAQSGKEIVLVTERKGAAHMVSLALEGANRQRVPHDMLIDTGADQVVLPASLIGTLGLSAKTLQSQTVQTANGAVDARIGVIPALWIGELRIPDVGAAFIDDRKLGGSALLGMSVLGRFRMTIDDDKNRLTLTAK